MTSSLEEIKNEEEDIFEDLGHYDFQKKPQFLHEGSRSKARQQLAVSEDSPFNLTSECLDENESRRLREERTALLRSETEQIKSQLGLVKSRIDELKKGRLNPKLAQVSESPIKSLLSKLTPRSEPPLPTVATKPTKSVANNDKELKLRPLTGKADCPNCECDRRRSVCDMCIRLKPTGLRSKQAHDSQVNVRPWPTIEDERPIRPASKTRTLGVVEAVDAVTVPGRVYTISRSLDDKRTKLAQAIDDLHCMIDQVKVQGDQLDRERKVAQLYKEQWKFGPSIGGPKGSSREHLGPKNQAHKRTYESRLDANLSRDIKSLMGYRTTETKVQSRPYNDRMNRIPLRKQQVGGIQPRSKSHESLASKAAKSSPLGKPQAKLQKMQPSRSSSDTDLNMKSLGKQRENLEIASDEQTDEECEVIDASSPPPPPSGNSADSNNEPKPAEEPSEVQGSNEAQGDGDQAVQRLTWVPVFGETEIKTVNKKPTRRKILVIDPSTSPTLARETRNTISDVEGFNLQGSVSAGAAQTKSSSAPPTSRRLPSSINEHVINGAHRRLKFATDLLNQEHRDSQVKNQLVIQRRPVLKSSLRTPAAAKQPVAAAVGQKPTTESNKERKVNQQVQTDPSREIARLEAMISDQQRLLAKLTDQTQGERQLTISPVNVQCSGTCRCHDQQPATSSPAKRTLINGLRDRLNKTRTKLARTLEQERAKHQQLRLKMDSSLKKQSDLEYENELLKQSLSKCIDTCLRDISTTFESINDSLSETVLARDEEDGNAVRQVDGKVLCNAAQFIANNRHLRQMKLRVENIEHQRKVIFDELGKEKQKTSQLELELKQSKVELEQLMGTKQRLESQLNESMTSEVIARVATKLSANPNPSPSPVPSTSKQQVDVVDDRDNMESEMQATDKSEMDDATYNSVEAYRRYIQSISPDIESIRNERKMILSEFDNIRKMLTNLNSETNDDQ